jgi:cytochrome P450
MEIILLLATIGQRFKLTLAPDHKVALFPALSLRPRDGIKVVVHKR